MGKTPKKAAPGGDERNLYNRRLKATTAPSNSSETSLHKRQRESEISNRSKLSSLKKIPPGSKKNLGIKVRSAAKYRPTKPVGRPPGSIKDKTLTVPKKSKESTLLNMQPESEEAELKVDTTVQKETSNDEVSKSPPNSNKEHVDRASLEPAAVSKTSKDVVDTEIVVEKEQTECPEKATDSEKDKQAEEHEENDLNLRFEVEDAGVKTTEPLVDDKDSKEEGSEKCPLVATTTKNGVHEKEDLQSESHTDTESYSVDALEFTTSELSEASESTSQNDAQKEQEEKSEESSSKDVSFISYDPSIMLKDVQIKLNDCLKENSKVLDTSNSDQSTPSQPPKDMSFGKSLRSISGRRSLNRMRYVTLREHRYSPNDSMFVNTSSTSISQNDPADFKILRYSTGLSDTLSTTNGSPTERKRKHETEDWNSTKKQKTESENSLVNSSISLLKGLRRPIQVSTPISELKFETGKLEFEEESKPANEGSKKWCTIM